MTWDGKTERRKRGADRATISLWQAIRQHSVTSGLLGTLIATISWAAWSMLAPMVMTPSKADAVVAHIATSTMQTEAARERDTQLLGMIQAQGSVIERQGAATTELATQVRLVGQAQIETLRQVERLTRIVDQMSTERRAGMR